MAYEDKCMFCFENNGGRDVCPHCGRDAREEVSPMHLPPRTYVYHGRFLLGRAIGQDDGGIVYNAYDTKNNNVIRIREYMPRDSARRLESGRLEPESGLEDRFRDGLERLHRSADNVTGKKSIKHFFFEENGTAYIAERKRNTDDDDEHSGGTSKTFMIVIIAAVLVLGVAAGVIALVSYFTRSSDIKTVEPLTTGEDVWIPPESATPEPYATATFAPIIETTNSWMDFTSPDKKTQPGENENPTPAATLDTEKTISSYSDSEAVITLQNVLAYLGWLEENDVTGTYDSVTVKAVKDFQSHINKLQGKTVLTVDGIAGPRTLAYLADYTNIKPTSTPLAVTPDPKYNEYIVDEYATKDKINYIQTKLVALGVLSDAYPNGNFDTVTRNAVMRFQKRVNELQGFAALRVDGTVDAATVSYLNYYADWWRVNNPTGKPTKAPEPTLGATGAPDDETGIVVDADSSEASIMYVQQMLSELEYYSGDIDGVYSEEVYKAVGDFQQFVNDTHNAGIEKTGKCDVTTLNYLEYYYNLGSESDIGSAVPQISVSGFETYTGGVYSVGENGVSLTWTTETEDGENFSVYLYSEDGSIITKEENTSYTNLLLSIDQLKNAGVCTFKVYTLIGGVENETCSARVSFEAVKEDGIMPGNEVSISVSGAERYSSGVYYLTGNTAISWDAAGISTYSFYLTDESNYTLAQSKESKEKAFNLDALTLERGEKYRFTVVAIPDGKKEHEGIYSSVSLVYEGEKEPTQEPAKDLTVPEIFVAGALGYVDEIYWAADDALIISWDASGSVRAYSTYLKNASGTPLISRRETDETSIEINPRSMAANEVYTFTVIAIPENGTEENGTTAAVKLQLYTGQTATPEPEKMIETGSVNISVDGSTGYEDGVYYTDGEGAFSFKWNAENAESYSIIIEGSDGEVMTEKKSTTKTGTTVAPEDMKDGITYTLTVNAEVKKGTGSTASVEFAKAAPSQAGVPDITVDGSEGEEDGVYLIGETATISYKAAFAETYSVYLAASDGSLAYSDNGITADYLTVNEDMLTYGETYTLTVIAMTEEQDENDGTRANINITRKNEPETEIGEVIMSVSGNEDYDGEVYYMGNNLSVQWECEGADLYDVYLKGPNGKKIKSAEDTTVTGMKLDGTDMDNDSVYTLTVRAKHNKQQKESAIMIARRVASEFVINVEGYDDFDGEIYYGTDGVFDISYSMEGASEYRIVVSKEDGEIIRDKSGVTDERFSVKCSGMESDVLYYVTVSSDVSDEEKTVKLVREEKDMSIMPVEPEEGPEPEDEPEPEIEEDDFGDGYPMLALKVKNMADVTNGVYLVSEDKNLDIAWEKTKGGKYVIELFDARGNSVKATEASENTAFIKYSWLDKDEIYVLTITSKAKDGTVNGRASINVACEDTTADLSAFIEFIDTESSPEAILDMQTKLYRLGWLDESAEKGVLDDKTLLAVYEYQTYIIENDMNPELEVIDMDDPVIDAVTLSMLSDAEFPIENPNR